MVATPRTDAYLELLCGGDAKLLLPQEIWFADFTRKIERENARLRKALTVIIANFDALPIGHEAKVAKLNINLGRAALKDSPC